MLEAEAATVPEQIEAVVNHGAEALRWSGESVTYAELNLRANAYASCFVRRGVDPGGAAAICLNRSFDGIAAALGAMRAGAAYVPIDPAWPDARLRYAIADSGAQVLVAREPLARRIGAGIHSIDPNRERFLLEDPGTMHWKKIDPASLAYVIYTSGSTGVPKGVEITHSNLAHLVRWHQRAFEVNANDCASHMAGLGFDASVWELWPNLCAGATVVLVEEEARMSPELLQKWMLHEQVTIAYVPTVHAGPMLRMQWPEDSALRILLTGGDVLQQHPKKLPFAVFNNYGPTECTVVSTSAELPQGKDGVPSIGNAIEGSSIYLLDESGVPVPDGSAGELYVGGSGVGRGYRNLQEPTAERFLPDPFRGVPEARMFRTGDRARRLASGELQFLGRLDRQVKIRGQRLELDEIGAVLSRHPAVEFATATAIPASDGQKQLVAYVLVGREMKAPAVDELQRHLRQSLPEYMIPSAIMQLDEIPLSSSGKVDYGKLPPVPPRTLVAVSTRSNKLLITLRQLMECETLTEDDNFFLVGGDSLLGMQIVLQIQSDYGLKIDLQQLFESPTVRELSLLLERLQFEQHLMAVWKQVLPLQTVGADEDFFLIGGTQRSAEVVCERIAAETGQTMTLAEFRSNPTIRRQAEFALGRSRILHALPPGMLALRPIGSRERIFWVHYLNANLARAIEDDQPFFSVTLTREDVAALGPRPSLQSIAAHMVKKIRTAQSTGPYILGGLCLGGVLAWEIASQLRALGDEVKLLVVIDPPTPACGGNGGSLERRWVYLRYVMKRAEWLGIRTTLLYSLERVVKTLPRPIWKRFGVEEIHVAQRMLESAVYAYEPRGYDRTVLLLLASGQPWHVDSLAHWRGLASGNLRLEYVQAYHRELMEPENARRIAQIIASQLSSEPVHAAGDCNAA